VDIGPGVQKLDVGDEVWAVAPFWAPGTISDFVLLPEECVAKKPRTVGFEGAASLPYSGCLAYSACVKAGIIGAESGKRYALHIRVHTVCCAFRSLQYGTNVDF